MNTGRVLWWSLRDRNGIIVDADGNEWYFDISVLCRSERTPIRGQSVSFSRNIIIPEILAASSVCLH